MDNTQESEFQSFTFHGEGKSTIHARKWIPLSAEIKAVLIINHGMAEHIGRYHSFASYLSGFGIAVYGEDHRGHGLTAGSEESLGHFSDADGWMKVIGDIRSLHLLVMEEQKGLPVFMLGHSMGSFLTRHYLSLYGSELKGAVISGTGFQSPSVLKLAKFIARIESFLKGSHHRSKLLDKLSFGSYNKSFNYENCTGFEWLSSDPIEVRKYVDDPFCGFICSIGFYKDLSDGLLIIGRQQCFSSTPNDLPILVISGKDDPVGNMGKGVDMVVDLYKSNGVKDLIVLIKDGMRHECLNELHKEECYKDILDWLTTRITG